MGKGGWVWYDGGVGGCGIEVRMRRRMWDGEHGGKTMGIL